MPPEICLTSIPPRFDGLGPVLASLVAQGAGTVNLFIPGAYRRFPDWDGRLPEVPDGVVITRSLDYGPVSKLLPALGLFDDDQPILICDDDCLYSEGWADGFARAAHAHPGCAIAASTFPVRRLRLDQADQSALIVQGFAGVMLTPAMLAREPLDFQARYVDDIWLSAMLCVQETAIFEVRDLRKRVTPLDRPASLQDAGTGLPDRAEANRTVAQALARKYKIWGEVAP